jgi:hypothetical protein
VSSARGIQVAVSEGMRRFALRLLVVTLAGLCAACASARGIRFGAPAPARAPNCALSYARIAPADAQAQWRQVGDVCLSNPSGLDIDDIYSSVDAREQLAGQACFLGGEMVTPVGLCANGRSSAVEFGVYVRR